ncbi:hypothetical protein [Cumulibacter manganitolerans]|uniref:hypothetical protein n=1 Tax=Cumulibacter manganitolerans TaxID=1884992 RepID=UPI00129636E6|nr:hypothetical protein [Cumulibacter manganitolerans]
MSAKLTTTKKIAGVASAFAVLFAGAACTKQVTGTATAAPHSEKTTEKTTEKSSSKSSSKSGSKTSSEDSTSESSSGGNGGGTAAAPEQPYSYTDGTTVKLDAATEKNDISGLLSNEVGRVLTFHVDNKSKYTLDLSSTATYAEVDCEGSSEYVFPSEPIGGPEQLSSGQKGDYQLYVGVKKADVGKTCTITFPFKTTDSGVTVDEATFSMKVS